MNSSNGNMAEYTVERKATGKYLKYKIGCLALYAAIILAYFCTTVALSSYGVWVAIVIIPFVPLFIMLLRHYVWNRYVSVEYRYEINSAYIIFYEVYGKQRESRIYERLISEYSLIAPMTDEYKDKYNALRTEYELNKRTLNDLQSKFLENQIELVKVKKSLIDVQE